MQLHPPLPPQLPQLPQLLQLELLFEPVDPDVPAAAPPGAPPLLLVPPVPVFPALVPAFVPAFVPELVPALVPALVAEPALLPPLDPTLPPLTPPELFPALVPEGVPGALLPQEVMAPQRLMGKFTQSSKALAQPELLQLALHEPHDCGSARTVTFVFVLPLDEPFVPAVVVVATDEG